MNISYADFITTLCTHLNHMNDNNDDTLFSISFKTGEPGRPAFIDISTTDRKKMKISCRIDALSAWHKCRNESDIQNLAERAFTDILQITKADCAGQAEFLHNYMKSRSRLCVRLINRSQADENSHIMQTFGDIALVVYFLFENTGDSLSSIKVPRKILAEWGKTDLQIISEALLNTLVQSPPRIFRLEDMLTIPDYEGEDFLDPSFRELSEYHLYHGLCLSTSKRTNGAAAAVLPGVCKRLAQLMGGDLYLVFTSIHEVMVHRTDTISPEGLAEVLRDTIADATPEEDILTRKIYRYDQKTNEIQTVDN